MTNRLQCIALATGHVEDIARDAVLNADIAVCAELLDGVLLGGVLPVAGRADYLMDGSHYRDDLKVTLSYGTPLRRIPILTAGVARGPTPGVALWREMHRSARVPLATDTTVPPPEPWLAYRAEPDNPHHPEAAAWTGGWLQCLGWTWMEYGRD